jgi:hypothetical protein
VITVRAVQREFCLFFEGVENDEKAKGRKRVTKGLGVAGEEAIKRR